MRYLFSPSLMCMNLLEMGRQIEILNAKADLLHIDIMDGHYVKNITLSPLFMEPLKRKARVPMDVHLMVENPTDFIQTVAEAGAAIISPHAETINKDAFRIIDQIKNLGCKVGVVLNPATPLDYIQHYIHLVDKITIMTVDPGYAGQRFIPEMLDKIRRAKDLKERNGFRYLIEADGSCNAKTFKPLADAGTEVFIVGSSGLFNLNPDLEVAWDMMIHNFREAVGGLIS